MSFEYSWMLCAALGVVLVGTSYHITKLEKQINTLKTEKQYLEANYKAEKELWENTVQEQNLKIEQYKADVEGYICSTKSNTDKIVSKNNSKQKELAERIATDSSIENQIKELSRLLHEFSENR